MREKEKFIIARFKRRLLQHVQLTRILVLVSVILLVFVSLVFITPRAIRFGQKLSIGYRYLSTFVRGPSALKNTNGVTNVLLLGVGGPGHEGPDLTDSMTLFSYNQSLGKMTLISIPRDLWIPEIRAKINTAYHYGEEKKPGGGGFVLVKSIVQEVTGQQVHYVLIIDFSLFREVIDILGGVNVCVDRAFDDFRYPIPGMENAQPEPLRYEHLHFDAGCQMMNGDIALKFVRSRYAQGEEGTDFARSSRQQKVLLATKEKLISKGLIFDLNTFLRVKDSVLRNLATDIAPEDYPAFARLVLKYRSENVATGVLDIDDPVASHSGLLLNPPLSSEEDGQWVLIPKAGQGNWTEIQKYISTLITN